MNFSINTTLSEILNGTGGILVPVDPTEKKEGSPDYRGAIERQIKTESGYKTVARLELSGWNSASNSIGTALAQGAIVVLQSSLLSPAALPSLYAQNLTFNCARFLDDWAYQQKIRYKIKDFQELNGIDTQHTAPYTSLVENYIARELAVYKNILLYTSLRRFPFYQFGKTAYYLKDLDYHVKLPWERVFEISLTVQPTFVKKTI